MRLIFFVSIILFSLSSFGGMTNDNLLGDMPQISGNTTSLGDVSTAPQIDKAPEVQTATKPAPPAGQPEGKIEAENLPKMPRSTDGDFSQFLTLQGGTFSPQAVVVSNGDYKFNYSSQSTQSYAVEAGWAIRLFRLLGAFHLEENLDFTSLQGQTPSNIRGVNESQALNLYLMGLDTRIMYSMEWFPWKRLIPFVDGGYRFTFYSQSGPSDLESAQGEVGNAVGGVGFRFWLNRGSFTGDDLTQRYTSIPIFLTGKYTHIFPSGQDLELSSDAYLGGVAIAL